MEYRQDMKFCIGGVCFPVIGYEDAIYLFEEWMGSRLAHQVCIVNVHTLVTAMRDHEYRAVLHDAALATVDGQPLKWYANSVCEAGVKERVCGPELMSRCLAGGVEREWGHYFLGGRPEVLESLESRVREQYPGVRVAGSYSPPFRPPTEAEEKEMVERINGSGAQLLWVGLGAPRQEMWIHRNLKRLRIPVCIGVGAAFDFHAGSILRAPAWMQNVGLEWLYRACVDPRLFRRYLDTNPQFLWMLIKDWVKVRLLRKSGICGE